jgi:hypothetical protein
MRRMILLLLLALPLFAADRFSYVYSRPEGSDTISRGSLEEVVRLKKHFGNGAYLWARLDGTEYMIRDAAVLDEVRVALRPLDALRPQQRSLQAKMHPLEQREERLESEMDAITDRRDDGERMSADDEARLDDLRRDLRDVRRELRVYEAEERTLDRREDELDKVFDAEIERIVRQAVRSGAARRLD